MFKNKLIQKINKVVVGFIIVSIFSITSLTPTPVFAAEDDGVGSIATSAIESTATCSVGAILGRLISSTIGRIVQELVGLLKSLITNFVKDVSSQILKETATGASVIKVPVVATETNIELVKQKNELRQLTAKETGVAGTDTDSLLSGIVNSISNISLDSIMFCIVNEILTYITESTINWINSGFDGNPVFVQNPRALFQEIADRESSNFASEIANGINGAQNQIVNGIAGGIRDGIISIAEPLKESAIQSIIGSSNYTFADSVRPTMSPELLENYEQYITGQQSMGPGYLAQVFRPENNARGVSMLTQQENYRRIMAEQQNQAMQLEHSNGYKSFTECPEGHLRDDGSCDPRYTQATVTGSQVKDELQSRGLMKYLRISFAQDFDSIVTALVNQLVRIAVNEVFEAVQQ